MRESDLVAADRIFRLAFGDYLGLPDPMRFAGDSNWIGTRWRTTRSAAFVAEHDGAVVGSVLAVHWGSPAFSGPVSVRPDLWNLGIARRLLEPLMARFAEWRVTHAVLFRFAQSAKHVALYAKLGFHPNSLTAVMAALDVGDTLLIGAGATLAGVALCHVDAGSEAGSDTGYVELAAVRPGADAARDFDRLLDACEAFARARGTATLVAGTNLAREAGCRRMTARGFRTTLQGVAMHRPSETCYCRPDAWAIDDWR